MGTRSPSGPGSLRLPSQDLSNRAMSPTGPVRYVVMSLNAVAVALIALVCLVLSPIIAMGTGLWELLTEIRDTAVRPRPFVGAKHGFPFLDPPAAPTPAAEPEASPES
jgi:hypothetical protein